MSGLTEPERVHLAEPVPLRELLAAWLASLPPREPS
jgi:hypothetical protein